MIAIWPKVICFYKQLHLLPIYVFYPPLLFCQTPILGLGLGVDFTFAGDNDNNHNHKNHNNDNNPHINFVKGTVLGDKEQGVGIRDKG